MTRKTFAASFVYDEANVLSNKEETDLNNRLIQYTDQTTNQIVVLLVPTTGKESIEKYSYDRASGYGIGHKGKDNGILITIAVKDHKDRIEVGKGLEDKVTDSRSGRILRSESVTSAFRAGKWYEGASSIVSEVQKCIDTDGSSVQALKENSTSKLNSSSRFALIITFITINVFMWLFYFVVRRRRRTSLPGGDFSNDNDNDNDDFSSGSSFGGGGFGGGGASGDW
jgi:uncharacterized protein